MPLPKYPEIHEFDGAEFVRVSDYDLLRVQSGEPVAVVMATGGPHDREDRVLVELQAELPPVGTKLYAGVASSKDLEDMRNLLYKWTQHFGDMRKLSECYSKTEALLSRIKL
ncbi:hypothetical protein CNR33_00004 [Pseudomonas phage tabernarius]|uniref:Uncharacterized protein n=1 Tax=Pseudomonas phage tabernarius TaxID=2048978 RepID=A0A2H4P747_9CAUD|nr:hypothetical protein FDJ17_gp04 [Pseudomonas phage tabernarius]ATW57850.1 hypothetical protein CNR33_00004 [Pseudomonas phage tabernarius]